MPNPNNTLAPNNNITIVSRKFIENFYTKVIPLSVFMTDFSDEIAKFGAAVQVAINGIRTASTRSDQTASYTDNATALSVASATLNQDVYDQAAFTNEDFAKSNVNLIRSQVIPAAQAMALELQTLAFNNITSGNYANNFACTSGNFTYANLLQLATNAKLLNWGPEKYLVLHPAYVQTLLAANQITNSLIPKTPELAVVEGYVARIAGFEVFESTALSTAGATGGNGFTGFACTPTAMVLAARQYAPPMPGTAAVVQTPLTCDNGLTVTQTEYWDNSTAMQKIRWNVLFGSGVGLGSALIRITNS